MARLRKTHITCTLLAKVKGKSNERVFKLNLYHKEGERGGSGAVPEEILINPTNSAKNSKSITRVTAGILLCG